MNKYEYIINQSRDFITLINKEYTYEVVNDAYCNAMGIKKEDIVNKKVYEIWGMERFNSLIKKDIDKCFAGEDVHLIDKFKFGDKEKYIHVTYYPYYENNQIVAALVFSHDITKIQEMEIKIFDYEFKDTMTGLFNKKSFDIMLEMELYKAERSKTENKRALLIINIVNLTKVNQLYGYETGDVILEKTGIRIKNILRNSDYVFRFYEKEFAVILTSVNENKDISLVVDKICAEVTKPYLFNNIELSVDCNIGVAIYPYDGKTNKEILNNALSSVREARNSNKKYLFFNKEIQKKINKHTEIELEIKKAINENQFELYYQPIVNCDKKIVGAEALIRWKHPKKGIISPIDFIPIAEETRMIIEIGKWAIKEVCHQLKKWSKSFGIYVSVNFSTIEFDSPNFIEVIRQTIIKSEFSDVNLLKVEITETNAMYNFDESIKKILELKEIGIDTFIDDFGIGYSSLSYLKKLPIETFKLDKLFIDNIAIDNNERKFAESIIKMIKSREKTVIVEGVSCIEQFDILKELGCDKMQGYYFSKPTR
ncbi:MAG TPA: EAL domain-containing protein [Spirochaetota bacterium]|nr:EAL domain-containing protein [Spirochaetota bacterium]